MDHALKLGDPLDKPPWSVICRFLGKVIFTDSGCWQWIGATSEGRPRLKWKRKTYRVYRLAYAYFVNPIPEEMDIHHQCRNPLCVNPKHLELRSRSWNSKDGADGQWDQKKSVPGQQEVPF